MAGFLALAGGGREQVRRHERVTSRATSSEASTAADTVTPKGAKYWPTKPPMKLTGRNTATMVAVMATTAKPMASDASSAAR